MTHSLVVGDAEAGDVRGCLVAVPVGEVLTVPQCLKMEKPSTNVVREGQHANKITKRRRNTVIVTILLHPLSELPHTVPPNVVFTVGSDRMIKTSMVSKSDVYCEYRRGRGSSGNGRERN